MGTTSSHKWLFRQPVKSDWAFLLWVGISVLATLATFLGNVSTGGIGGSGTFGAISGFIDAVFVISGNFFAWYIVSLIWLIPRRLLSK
jgi:hypothetical protein